MSQSNPIHIAILDLYEGSANVGMIGVKNNLSQS